MLGTLLSQVSLIMVVVVCGLALVLGGTKARLAGGMYLLIFAAQAATYYLGFTAPAVNLLLDGLLLLGFVGLCWKAPHPWPVWASGAQLISVMIPVVSLTDTGIKPWAYYTAMTLSGYVVLSTIAVGTMIFIRHSKQRHMTKIG